MKPVESEICFWISASQPSFYSVPVGTNVISAAKSVFPVSQMKAVSLADISTQFNNSTDTCDKMVIYYTQV